MNVVDHLYRVKVASGYDREGEEWPLIDTNCIRLLLYDLNQLRAEPLIP